MVTSTYEMFVRFPNACFELLGFDILIDSHYKPWLLEVNLSPSLNCDSPIDLKIKSNLIADLLNLAGVRRHSKIQRCLSRERPKWNPNHAQSFDREAIMSAEEARVIKSMQAEDKRLGGFERIYPTKDSKSYRKFFDEDRPLNAIAIAHLNGQPMVTSARSRVLKPKIPRKTPVTHLLGNRRPRERKIYQRKASGDLSLRYMSL